MMDDYKLNIKKSVQSDYKFCEKIDKKCLGKIKELEEQLKLADDNPDYFMQLHGRNTEKHKRSEIYRLKSLQKNLISKKYIFENKVVYITYKSYLLGDRDQIEYIEDIEYLSKDHEHGRFYLNFQINEAHEKLGKVLEVWEQYEIEQQNSELHDLRNIRFETLNGRDFCESYRELIFRENIDSKKINIKKIFSYKNIIQSPEQNKLYDLIIEDRKKFILVNGQAGTGKTTVAIDALKNTVTIFIVLNDTKKTEIEQFYNNKRSTSVILFEDMHSFLNEALSIKINNNYNSVLEQVETLAKKIISENDKLSKFLQLDEIVIRDELKKPFEIVQALILNNSIEPINMDDLIKKLKIKLSNMAIKINNIYVSTKVPFIKTFDLKKNSKIKFRVAKPETSKEIKSYRDIKVVLEETIAKKALNAENIKFTHKKITFDFLNRLLNKRKNKFDKKAFEDIEKIIYSQQFISKYFFQYQNPDIVYLTKCYLANSTNFTFFKKIDKSVLIDEYQQLKQPEIVEMYKMVFERVILVGDDAQTNQKSIYTPRNDKFEKLIFTRNFRQTYQLAVASLIIRNLITNDIIEIPKENDYYRDQIEFNGERYKKPYFYHNIDSKQEVILEKLIEIKKNQIDSYEHDFPVMIVFEKSSENQIRLLYKNLKEKFKVVYFENLKENNLEDFDFVFLTVKDIQGEEAPIVVYISEDEKINLSSLYISITRAQFEFYNFSKDLPIFKDEHKNCFELFKKNGNNNFVIKQKTLQIPEKHFYEKKEKDEDNTQIVDVKNVEPEIKKDDRSKLEKKNSNQNIKIRVHEIAKELNLSSKDVVKKAKEIGLNVKSANSSLSVKEAENFKNYIRNSEQQDDEDKKALTTKQNIEKHKSETNQWQEDIDPDIIIDEEQYKKDFIKKVSEDIQNYEASSKQQEIIKEIVILKKTNITDNEQKNKIRIFLANTYKGYCQICGFTFRKVADGQKSFEMYSWNDKRVVKKKKSFISTADSLSLCRNCSANIKWGAFEPTFLEHIKNIQNFETATIEDIKKEIHKAVDENLPDIFEGYLNFNDMYALEIKLNDEAKNIYFTDIHLVQFIAYLQLESNFAESQ
ncbi:MAG: translation initiation factor IF-2 N-terminal domain-containing protein [Sulfurimonas sp.]|jgi:hypothetical protein|uniref:translation initiation factor IF-2 N-terminal domain-containing protein n=1 Tax=Sulfurimonas sp. TaxID=2022749 RepID=UPI00356A9CF3